MVRPGRWVAVSLCVATASGAAGVAVEAGGGLASPSGALDAALEARFSRPGGSNLELRARGFAGLDGWWFRGAALELRYRTPPLGDTWAFTTAFGGGLMFWGACVRGDACGGLGTLFEVSPTLELRVSDVVHPYFAVNLGLGGVVLLGNPALIATGTAVLGVAFDFAAPKRASVPPP